jgi:uncharacterized protein
MERDTQRAMTIDMVLLTIIVADRAAAARAGPQTDDQRPTTNDQRLTTNMPVDPELLEILACPNCKTKVELVKGGTALKCPQCRRVYPIKDDIPVMLIDEATIEP